MAKNRGQVKPGSTVVIISYEWIKQPFGMFNKFYMKLSRV